MQHEAWFFIGLFVFIFIIWIAIGGPTRAVDFSGPTVSFPEGTTTPSGTGGGTSISLPRSPYGIGTSNVELPGSTGGEPFFPGTGGGTPGFPSYPSLPGTTFGTPSPHYGIVTLNRYVSGAGSSNPASEYVMFAVSARAAESVPVTGWLLASTPSGTVGTIPYGTPLLVTGVVNPLQSIVLSPGETAIIVSGLSPNGYSFRENKCTGYLGQYQPYVPPLPKDCPAPHDELVAIYGNAYLRDYACVEYVSKLPRCQAVVSPPATLSSACRSYITNSLTYNACIEVHENDADFNRHTWRIYLGRAFPMWRPSYEVIKLIDREGKTVDAFSY